MRVTISTAMLCAVVFSLYVASSASASVGALTVTLTPSSACSPAPDGIFDVGGNDAPYLGFGCAGGFAVGGVPAGAACCNDYAAAQVNAPPGITITDAAATGDIELDNGWTGGSYSSDGGTAYWTSAGRTFTDAPFASPYWGFQVWCPAGSSCTGGASIELSSIKLTATESSGPILDAEGSENLWYQDVAGEWIWNPSDDPWPITLAASDPSGVCSMWVSIGAHQIPGPSAVPNTSQFQQCPDPTWTPSGGAIVDTRDFVPGAQSAPLTITAINASGRTTSSSEDLNVDNDPVGLTFATPNDPNPTVWVNHDVVVDVSATAGPSGIGGISCGVDDKGAEPYPPDGVAVTGDGVHTVSCTAWNRAVDPQGQPNSTTNSIEVHIDEAPPTLQFEPQDPRDPTALVVDATDDESGVASGSIEMAQADSNDWTTLATTLNGGQLATHFDDADRTGPYVFKATSCDNVGNCASASEQLTLPLRAASDSEVSLTSIVNPGHHRVVYERVLVGWHWLTIRRDGQLVRIKVGGHFKTIKVIEATGPKQHATSTLRVAYGHSVTIHGLYTTNQGAPLAGQPVHIVAAPDNHTDAFTPLTTVTTTADGSWTAIVPAGPSRIIQAATDGTATILPSSGQVTTVVPVDIKLLDVWPRHVAWGGTAHLVGQLLGGYLPPGGALVRLRIGYGSTYTTYGVQEHVTGDGRFSTVATFGPGDPSIYRTYWFQIASLPMGNYPYAPAASQRVAVTVGGHPG
jgi:hypothetical protein